jgi:hypothetical protein
MRRTPLVVVFLAVCALFLGGCGKINTSLSHALADGVPVWAGGLPKNAPPRPGDPRYAGFMRKLMGNAVVANKPTLILKQKQRRVLARAAE